MKLSKILSVHKKATDEHPNKLVYQDILGDAFLFNKNLIYRSIRNYSIEIGCQYHEAWPKYLIMPFQALGEIISLKKIPYVPAASLLNELEHRRANVLTIDDISIPESHHMHEAAHVIAENIFQNCHLNNVQEKILKSIICESFANTVDALAWNLVEDNDDMHALFLNHQSYMHPNRKDIATIKKLTNTYGLRLTFLLMMVAYIHANFLIEKIPNQVIEKIVQASDSKLIFDQKILKDCENIMKVAEKLDPQFRIQTTQTYLKLEGYTGDIFQLLDFPFMKLLNSKTEFKNAFETMADLVRY